MTDGERDPGKGGGDLIPGESDEKSVLKIMRGQSVRKMSCMVASRARADALVHCSETFRPDVICVLIPTVSHGYQG